MLKPNDVQWKERKRSMKEGWNISHRWDLFVPAAACNPAVCSTLERGGFLFMSKDVESKLRQECLSVETEERAMEVEEEEHERRLEFQPSVGSGRCSRSLEPTGVLYTGSRWFSVHFERFGMEAETGAWSLWF